MTNPRATSTHRSTADAGAAAPAEIGFETRGAAAVITLDRPRALNAITTAMRSAMAEAFQRYARDPVIYCVVLRSANPRAFSAGGDVRELTGWGRTDIARARQAFADEYRLNWALDCFTKPTISLIDGIVMGSGVGLSLYGTHRVAGEAYRFAMPETAIGLFPDVGAVRAFARMPDEIGTYLALTGRQIGRADAFALGLVTHCIAAAHHAAIVTALADAQPVDQVLDALHADPGTGEISVVRETIRACFSAPSLDGILARLAAVEGTNAAWAAAVLADLLARSPTSLAITLRHLRETRERPADGQDLKHTLETDYRLACRCLEGHDFAEGVRAALIDKDGQPRWQPARVEDVTAEAIDRYFQPLTDGELVLAPRMQMQIPRG